MRAGWHNPKIMLNNPRDERGVRKIDAIFSKARDGAGKISASSQ